VKPDKAALTASWQGHQPINGQIPLTHEPMPAIA
jgi:hypothetical protein